MGAANMDQMEDPRKFLLKEEHIKKFEITPDQVAALKKLMKEVEEAKDKEMPGMKKEVHELYDIVKANSWGWQLKAMSHAKAVKGYKEHQEEMKEHVREEARKIFTTVQKAK